MKALLDRVGYSVVPMDSLGGEEELSLAFRNVNTREEAEEVEALMSSGDFPVRGMETKGRGGPTL